MVIATPYIGNVQKKRPAANAKENFFPLQSPTDATIRQGTMCDMPASQPATYYNYVSKPATLLRPADGLASYYIDQAHCFQIQDYP